MSNKTRPRPSTARPSAARRTQQRSASRRTVLAIVGGALALLAIIAIVISATGGSSDAGPQTQPVEITGAALPAYADGADAAVGVAAPEVHGSSFDGTPVHIMNDGHAKVVMFVAHWCPHCRAEVPRITEWLADSGMPADVDLYAVSTGVSADAPNYPPSKWLESEDWPIVTLADDADAQAAAAFGLQSYPYFVAIGADGDVVARASGELTQSQFEALIQQAAAA